MNKPARKSVRARWIVLTGQFNSSSNKNYVGTKFSCLKYDLQCTNFEPDKTYNTTMYVRPAKTQVSLCIDPLDKVSFLHTVRSAKGLNRMCCCSRTVYSALDSPAIDGKYDQRMILSECAGAYWPESSLVAQDVLLHPVITGGTYDKRRLWSDYWDLLMCSLRVCRLIRLFVQVLL